MFDKLLRRLRAVGGGPAVATESDLDPEILAQVRAVLDDRYYRETYGDISEAGLDPFNHYINYGRAELRRPSVLFDPEWYLARYTDVADAGLEPLEHYLKFGAFEGRDPIPLGFDSAWYLEENPELLETQVNPLVHFIQRGADAGLSPSKQFDLELYVTQYADVRESGLNPLTHFLLHGQAEGRRPNRRTMSLDGGETARPRAVADVLRDRQRDLAPLRTTPATSIPRLNIVTDSIGSDSLFGGVATALILGILWAERAGLALRIVTRHSPADAAGLGRLFRSIGIKPAQRPEFAYIPTGPGDYLEVGDGDVFLTTSWWTTTSVLESIPASRVAYILQEDERAFYPVGGSTLGAQSVMNRPDLTVVVNTRSLLEALIATGVSNLTTTASSFEPSFASFLRPGRTLSTDGKRDLFFYARPNNPRNLFDLGLAAIDAAVTDGTLDSSKWRLHFVGRSLPAIILSDGSRPEIHDALGWDEYRDLLGTIDLGISLMASPHPSYPPLDLAASGSVVLTNRWPGKLALSAVSDRLVETDSTADALLAGIKEAVQLVERVGGTPFAPDAVEWFDGWQSNLESTVARLIAAFPDA